LPQAAGPVQLVQKCTKFGRELRTFRRAREPAGRQPPALAFQARADSVRI